jgi:hypothetical protein
MEHLRIEKKCAIKVGVRLYASMFTYTMWLHSANVSKKHRKSNIK